ncbi:hypothetical protein ACELLULO517_22510 [Acidisoma cellulosilytica]|uniref:Uncharacterized protein n=1 Tax=Acidisoma cellulosilyticum TaxID=2802395 RepID=A0A964E6H3_9PROT|nr:hypothetical protein [Acidisoma cellulosilyticum]MCB8883038.1 hypothetical protein [Acidisoma cellulosilyticum]
MAPPALPDFHQPPPATQHYPLFDRLLACMVSAGQGIQALCLFLSLSRAVLDEHIIRLGIATPHDRPMRGGGAKAWSLRDTLRLIVWRLAAVHPDVIGQRLDTPRSANAVRAKARRLGIPCPDRKALHKPQPDSLRDPGVVDFMASIMLAGIEPGQTADEALKRLRESVVVSAAEVVSLPVKEGRPARKRNKAAGQREFPFFGIVPDQADQKVAQPEVLEIPSTENQVDFKENLTWFAGLKGRTKAQTNRVAVWVAFMLMAGGLHYKEAAKKLGVTPAAFRTFKTNVAIPSDSDRRKMGGVFDLDAAEATLKRSGYELKRCLKSDNWFWAKKSEKGVRLSPPFRRGEKIIGERGNKFTIVTRAMLDAENRIRHVPFAEMAAKVPA